MTIHRNEEWIQVAELDEHDQIVFTAAYRTLMEGLGWEAKAFAAHCIGLWYDPFEHLLDYGSGEAKITADQPGTFERSGLDAPQDVVEYWATTWSKTPKFSDTRPHECGLELGLDTAWYRDMLRAKLVSLRFPKRLLVAYRDAMLAELGRLEGDGA